MTESATSIDETVSAAGPKTCGDAGGRNAKGEPCRANFSLSVSSGLCRAHDPERAEEMKRVRVLGHEASRRRRAAVAAPEAPKGAKLPANIPTTPKTLDDAVSYYAWVVNAMAKGELDARTGHEIAFALNGFKAATEKRDLEREIKALRAQLEELKRPRRVS